MDDALQLKQTLDGVNIYPGCNNLKVQFSSMSELHVKANNSKAFDFTQALEPEKQPRPEKSEKSRREQRRKESVSITASPDSPTILVVSGLNTGVTKLEDVAALFAVYGNVSRVQLLWGRRSRDEAGVALVYMQDHLHCNVA